MIYEYTVADVEPLVQLCFRLKSRNVPTFVSLFIIRAVNDWYSGAPPHVRFETWWLNRRLDDFRRDAELDKYVYTNFIARKLKG